jgi:hypothetical protein
MDPNPAAAKREAKMIEEQAAEAIRRALPPDYVAELEGRDVDSRKKRKTEGNFGLEGYEAPDDVWFAKEKAEWIAQQRGLPSAGEGGTLPDWDVQETTEPQAELQEQHDVSGILSGATLAALKTRTTNASKVAFTTAKPAASSGPLVAYGSDDESD